MAEEYKKFNRRLTIIRESKTPNGKYSKGKYQNQAISPKKEEGSSPKKTNRFTSIVNAKVIPNLNNSFSGGDSKISSLLSPVKRK